MTAASTERRPVPTGSTSIGQWPGRPVRQADGWIVLAIAGVVFILAATLRLWRVRHAYELFIDEVTYVDIARNLALGHGVFLYGEPFFLHPPAMFGSLAMAMTLTGTGEDSAALAFALRPLPAVLGAFTPALTAVLTYRLSCSRVLAAAAGLLLAAEPFLIRFDSRVLLESQAMATATAGVLLVVVEREQRGAPVRTLSGLAGMLLLGSLLTKETYAFVTVLPVLVLLVTGLAMRRSTSAIALGVVVAGYTAYVLALVFAGQGGEWFEQKTRGVRRLLGLTQVTGFNQEGSVGFGDRILANLSNFGTTYALIGMGVIAWVWLVAKLSWREVPAEFRPGMLLLSTWSLGALIHLAYAVLFGTLEEQMFYLLVVTVVPTLLIALRTVLRSATEWRRHRAEPLLRVSASVLRAGGRIALAVVLALNSVIWLRVHSVPDDAYSRFLGWAAQAIPAGSSLAVTDETTQFVLKQFRIDRLHTGAELRARHSDYAVVLEELVGQGYSDVDEDYLRTVRRGPVVFQAEGRTFGTVTVYDLRRVTGE